MTPLLHALHYQPWLITPETHAAMLRALSRTELFSRGATAAAGTGAAHDRGWRRHRHHPRRADEAAGFLRSTAARRDGHGGRGRSARSRARPGRRAGGVSGCRFARRHGQRHAGAGRARRRGVEGEIHLRLHRWADVQRGLLDRFAGRRDLRHAERSCRLHRRAHADAR